MDCSSAHKSDHIRGSAVTEENITRLNDKNWRQAFFLHKSITSMAVMPSFKDYVQHCGLENENVQQVVFCIVVLVELTLLHSQNVSSDKVRLVYIL